MPDQQFSRQEDSQLLIVIVSWNVKDLLAACLASLSTSADGLSVRVVVVDNASADGTVEMVCRDFPQVEVISSTTNLGFSRGNNRALERYETGPKYFLLLNPDTVVEPGTLSSMLKFMNAQDDAGIIGCKIVKPDGSLDWPCKRSYITPSVLLFKALGLDRLFPHNRLFGKYQLTFLDEDAVHEVDSVVGAFLMIRGECLRQIGMLDESLFMYGEDLDWCYRAKAAGWKVFYVPTGRILHLKGQSSGKRSYGMIYY